MNKFFLLIILLFLFVPTWGQWDPIKEYQSRKFPCDTAVTTLDITFCVGYKNEFADSLLNKIYKKVLAESDKDINEVKGDIRKIQSKKAKTSKDSLDLAILKEELDHNIRYKTSVVNSQRTWLKSRQANVDIISINCEGGRECNAIMIEADTVEILERITKLMKLCFGCRYGDTPSR